MSKVITFSQKFPNNHPREGEPTYFVEQILNTLGIDYRSRDYVEQLVPLNWERDVSKGDLTRFWEELNKEVTSKKLHTIRKNHNWNQGDTFSPRVWSRTPRKSPQIIFAPDITIPKVYDFVIMKLTGGIFIHDMPFSLSGEEIEQVAWNDGLSESDFLNWFEYPKDFNGQIVCIEDPGY